MSFLSFIEAKRDGLALSAAQIGEMVSACVAGQVPDYQMAAFLMAVYFRGLNPEETRALTLSMRGSGEVLRLPQDPRPVVDKHSTGGVGDKISLPLAPLLACLGFRVPMISGRGLGITGGTLDKLESIPGFETALPASRIEETVQRVGCVICGQTEHMVPADKKLYALRDVTGTVPSISLIVASILSKKLAEQLDALVLDVKFGSAAFMPTAEAARELAQAMVALANECGVRTRALVTRMDVPLGRAAGNWLEVRESVAVLTPGDEGPPDVRHLTLECAAHLLVLAGKCPALDEARSRAAACLDSGEPLARWNAMLEAQGADLKAFQEKLRVDSNAGTVAECAARQSGFLTRCDARVIGEVIRDLGAGRLTKDTVIDPGVGIDRLKKPGEPVKAGEGLARVHARDRAAAEEACCRLQRAFDIAEEPPEETPLVVEVVG